MSYMSGTHHASVLKYLLSMYSVKRLELDPLPLLPLSHTKKSTKYTDTHLS